MFMLWIKCGEKWLYKDSTYCGKIISLQIKWRRVEMDLSHYYSEVLTPAITRLYSYFQAASEDLDPTIPPTDQKHLLLQLKHKLKATSNLITTQRDAWFTAIQSIPEPKQTEELNAFNSYFSGDKAFGTLVLTATEKLAVLDSFLSSLAEQSFGSQTEQTPSENGDSNGTTDASGTDSPVVMAAQPPVVSNVVNVEHSPSLPHAGNITTQGLEVRALNNPMSTTLVSSPVKLPKQVIPPFSGKVQDWPCFWDSYNYAVHTQPFPKIAKFGYLRAALSGSALKVIEGLPLSEHNYDVAIKILHDRFGNSAVIVDKLYRDLAKWFIPPSAKTYEVRKAWDILTSLVRQLESLQENVITNKSVITGILGKLPKEIQYKLEETLSPADLNNFDSISKQMNVLLSLKERIEDRDSNNHQQQSSKPKPKNNTLSGFYSSFSPQKPPPNSGVAGSGYLSRDCIFCGGKHMDDYCRQFDTIESRRSVILKKQLCYICFGKGHQAPQCKNSNMRCVYCKSLGHNYRVCYSNPNIKSQPKPTQQQTTKTNRLPSRGGYQRGRGRAPSQGQGFHGRGGQNQDNRNYGQGSYMCMEPIPQPPPIPLQNSPQAKALPSCPTSDHMEIKDEKNCLGVEIPLETDCSVLQPIGKKSKDSQLCLKMIEMKSASDANKKVSGFAFFDCGCQRTWITKKLSDALGCKVLFTETIPLSLFGGSSVYKINTPRVLLQLTDDTGKTFEIDANVISYLTRSLSMQELTAADVEVLTEWGISPDTLTLPNDGTTVSPDLVVGQDYFWDFLSPANMIKLPSGLFVISSVFGKMLGGSKMNPEQNQNIEISSVCLTDQVQNFWSLEHLAITEADTTNEDLHALQLFDESVTLENNRYHVRLPWKMEKPPLSSNFNVALKQLERNVVQLQNKPELLKMYNDIMEQQLSSHVLEEVTLDQFDGDVIHYMPHHGVVTMQKTTTKLRVVINGSCPCGPTTMNQCLHRGPMLLKNLCGILLRFRIKKIGLGGDLEKAFLQIGIKKEDRDACRILWLKDINKPVSADNVKILRFTRVLFGLICSPFLLNNTVKTHMEKQNHPFADQIKQNIYVDNFITSVDTLSEAKELYQYTKDVFQQASMNMREWMSNSVSLKEYIPDYDQAKQDKVKILGLKWNMSADILSLEVSSKPSENPNTKRDALSIISGVYDPLGFVTPVTLFGKLFMQDLWRHDCNWDDQLSDSHVIKLRKLEQEYNTIPEIQIPRWLGIYPQDKIQLHIFCDASGKGFAAVAYFRIEHSNGKVESTLLLSKTRISPLNKPVSIPRLELLAVLIGTRLIKFLQTEINIPIEKIYLWTDSECTLHWIKSNKKLSVFVRRRVEEIKAAKPVTLRYVPTDLNIADLATRGSTVEELKRSNWYSGPEFLQQHETNWPEGNIPMLTPELMEMVGKEEKGEETITELSGPVVTNSAFQPPIDFSHFSGLLKCLFTVIYVLRFLKGCIWNKLKLSTTQKYPLLNKIFTAIRLPTSRYKLDPGVVISDEISISTFLCEYWTQWTHFGNVFLELLHHKGRIHNPLILNLKLYIDKDQLLRCQGRFSNANWNPNMAFPKLLPSKSSFTRLVVNFQHCSLLHAGVSQTLSTLRQTYWIVHGRSVVKGIINKCSVCLRYSAKQFQYPLFPPFPADRLKITPPFFYTGTDYFGPITTCIQNAIVKVYVVIFTCFLSRAVHLDIAGDLSGKQFLLIFRRFVARFGQPGKILSDNAPQFHLVASTLDHTFRFLHQQEDVQNFSAKAGIKWIFIPPSAPWGGSLYERMIRTIKTSLRKSLGQKILPIEELRTLLSEITSVVNCRPLTYIYDEARGLVLRPIDLIQAVGDIQAPLLEEDHTDPEWTPPHINTANQLLQYWKTSQKWLDKFWKYFQSEYLLSLRERYQFKLSQPHSTTKRVPEVNEIVLLEDAQQPRNTWQLGRIVKLHFSSDNQIRSVDVCLPNKKIIKRPINKICPLEIKSQTSLPISSEDTDQDSTETSESASPVLHSKSLTEHVETFIQNIPKTFSLLNIVFFCSIILSLQSSVGASKCTPGNNYSIIQSQNCTQNGIVIKKYQDTYCWEEKRCPHGQQLNGFGTCNNSCPCPSWTNQCSHGTVQEDSSAPITLPGLDDERVCSFTPSTNCDNKTDESTFSQIQLMNNTLVIVNDLNLIMKEPSIEEYKCFGPNTMTPMGTSAYCAHHTCQNNSNTLCAYLGNDCTFFVSNFQHIQIKAWGTIMKKFYLPIAPQALSCAHCNSSCIPGGIKYSLGKQITKILICYQPTTCIPYHNLETSGILLLPPKITLYDYTLEVQYWSSGKFFGKQELNCPHHEFCELIDCYICLSRFRNPRCTPVTVISIAAIAFAISALLAWAGIISLCSLIFYLIFAVSKILSCCRYGCMLPFHACYYLFKKKKSSKKPKNKPPKTHAKLLHSKKRKSKHGLTTVTTMGIILSLILILFPHSVESCTKATTLTATRKQCELLAEQRVERCTISEATRLALVPQGQETCLFWRDANNTNIGVLKLKIHNIQMQCNARNLYFTRNFKLHVNSVKRCSHAGSCVGSTCENLKANDQIDELPEESFTHPGYSHCTASPGCWGNRCFFCDTACLFYRLFAKPSDTEIFELFDCPVWEFHIKIEATFVTANGDNQKMTPLLLHPNKPVSWHSLELALVGISYPAVPILGNKFITDQSRTAIVSASDSGQPLVGTIGQLQCANENAAKKFQCHFPENSCNCDPRDSVVHCHCRYVNINQVFKDEQKTLPLSLSGLTLNGKGKDIKVTFDSIANLEIQVTSKDHQLLHMFTATKCTITVLSATGCYSCTTGAKIKYNCQTTHGTALATVECGSQQPDLQFTANCNSDGHHGETTLAFTQATIDLPCKAYCPAGSTTFQLKAELMFIDKPSMATVEDEGKRIDVAAETNFPSLQGLFNWFTSSWKYLLTSIILGIIIFLCIWLCGPYCVLWMSASFRKLNSKLTPLSRIKERLQLDKSKTDLQHRQRRLAKTTLRQAKANKQTHQSMSHSSSQLMGKTKSHMP